jgi:ubiquinone/menaquinone biosynthesis C-methylase UbiE
MSDKIQKKAFTAYEADNFFLRNKEKKYDPDDDTIITVLKEYEVRPASVLEIGCNYGYRLDAISSLYPNSKTVVRGIEPSGLAIDQGRKLYPQVDFVNGTADDMSVFETSSVDLLIIGFVLYVVDREILFRVVAESDRVLKDSGVLMILDFFSEKPLRNPYQHINDAEAYAYKQNYEEIFIASKLYHLLDKRSMNHAHKGYDLSNDFYNKYSLATLKKDLFAGYK